MLDKYVVFCDIKNNDWIRSEVRFVTECQPSMITSHRTATCLQKLFLLNSLSGCPLIAIPERFKATFLPALRFLSSSCLQFVLWSSDSKDKTKANLSAFSSVPLCRCYKSILKAILPWGGTQRKKTPISCGSALVQLYCDTGKCQNVPTFSGCSSHGHQQAEQWAFCWAFSRVPATSLVSSLGSCPASQWDASSTPVPQVLDEGHACIQPAFWSAQV